MKRYLLFIPLLVLAVFAFGQDVPPKPNPPKLVNDITGKVLSADQVQALEQRLVAYDDSSSNQIVVVIVNTTDDYAPVDYATKLGREWGVGNKKTNNGLIILVAIKDRQMFISPGYGLEGALPDITAKAIIENEMKPQFRNDNYYRGLDNAVTAIMKAVKGEYKAPAGYRKKKGNDGGSILGVVIIIIIILVMIGRSGRGGGGGMVNRRGYRNTGAIPWFLGSGGSGGSGGGGGGGFGGFGGGSFGGGGAGGSW